MKTICIWKKDQVRFLSYFRYLSSSLYFNMGYSHIRLTTDVIDLYTSIIPWVKCRYKSLIMGVNNSLMTLYKKMNDYYQRFEFMCTSIEAFLILTEGY